jgi:ribosomal protein S18 acetylase RimI-like enzyme
VDEFTIGAAPPDLIADLWAGFTGLPIVTVSRTYDDFSEVAALVCRDATGAILGHVSFWADGDTGEIVTIEALDQGRHIGGRLLDAAEVHLRERGVKRIIVTTTNDNLRAQAFYMRRGYRLARIERDGMDRVRALKPAVPATGHEGLALVDMWEFEKVIE